MRPVLSSLKGWRRWLAIVVMLLAASFGLSQDQAEPAISVLEEQQPGLYRVETVVDGDTVEIDMYGVTERIRFIGLDTPEKNHPQKPVQCYSQAATEHLEQLIGSQPVRLESDPLNQNRDRYNRLLRYVFLPDGTLLNAQQIQDGYGFAYTAFPFTKLDEFIALERRARANNAGLWGSCDIEQNNGYINTNPA